MLFKGGLFSFVWNFQNRLNMASPVEYLWGVYWLGISLIILGCVVLIRSSFYQAHTQTLEPGTKNKH